MMNLVINQGHTSGRILLEKFFALDSILAVTKLVEDGFIR